MNVVILLGRLVRNPEIKRAAEGGTDYARYTLAIDRNGARKGDQNADFINCVVFGRDVDFVEKYLKQGMKVAICGRIRTGRYTDRDGRTVYTTDVVVEEHEFAENKDT